MDRPDCCRFVKLPHTNKEWLIRKTRCRGRFQEVPTNLTTTNSGCTYTKCSLCRGQKRPTSQEQPPRTIQNPTPGRFLISAAVSLAYQWSFSVERVAIIHSWGDPKKYGLRHS